MILTKADIRPVTTTTAVGCICIAVLLVDLSGDLKTSNFRAARPIDNLAN
jgi:hypothetical protein